MVIGNKTAFLVCVITWKFKKKRSKRGRNTVVINQPEARQAVKGRRN